MLIHPTIENLRYLKLAGMIHALEAQMQTPEADALTFDDRFGMLVDAEVTTRDNRRLQGRLRAAQLRQSAAIEDLDFRIARGLNRGMITKLGACAINEIMLEASI